MPSLFCLTVLPSNRPIPSISICSAVHHTTMQKQLPELAGRLRCVWGCYSVWSPQDTSQVYKLLQAIEAFQKDPPTTVFLLSMRAGSVGINLTAASHVFLLEPCINPALEEQVQLLEGQGHAWCAGLSPCASQHVSSRQICRICCAGGGACSCHLAGCPSSIISGFVEHSICTLCVSCFVRGVLSNID